MHFVAAKDIHATISRKSNQIYPHDDWLSFDQKNTERKRRSTILSNQQFLERQSAIHQFSDPVHAKLIYYFIEKNKTKYTDTHIDNLNEEKT